MPGVDRVVEGLDLAADVGLALGQLGDRGDLDAVGGEVLARAVGGETSTPRSSRSRARSTMPSRFATDSRARTRGFLPIPWARARVSGAGRGSPDGRDGAAPFGPSIPPDMAYSGCPSTRERRGRTRDARRPGNTSSCRSTATTSRTSSIRPGSPSLVLLVVLIDPLQRPDAGAPPPPAVPRDVGVAVVDRPHHVQPAHHRVAVRVRLLPRPADRRSSASGRWSGSASSGSRRSSPPTRRGWPASATSRSRSSPTPRRRSRSASGGRRAAAPAQRRRR